MSLVEQIDLFLEKKYPAKETSVYKDLTLNLKKLLDDTSPLDLKERILNVAAIARSLKWEELENFSEVHMKDMGLSVAEITEAFESAAIMGMLNTYYKFKSFLSSEVLSDPAYQRASLRMNSLGKPVNGKDKFEMMAFSVSVVNGCATCVASHEKALTDLGVSREKIHELARLASVIKGLSLI